MTVEFQSPAWSPHPLIRGGHLQTVLASVADGRRIGNVIRAAGTTTHEVQVSDGDKIVLHQDEPSRSHEDSSGRNGRRGSMLLVHGLTGCHQASYMVRLASLFLSQGYRTFRMDMRGFGAARSLSKNLSHAGRSDDVVAALDAIDHANPEDPIFAIGISLGGAQLLRAIGRVDSGSDSKASWRNRLAAIAAISPPIDLVRCSENMQRPSNRFYNRYFIRNLMKRLPLMVKQRDDFKRQMAGPSPRTLFELDDQFTAPLSGFSGAAQYYRESSAIDVVASIKVPTLILSAHDDPIVPIDCFVGQPGRFSGSTVVIDPPSGGHVGFIGRRRECLIDLAVPKFFDERRID